MACSSTFRHLPMYTTIPEAKNNKSQSEPFLLLRHLIADLILEGNSCVRSLCRMTTQLTRQKPWARMSSCGKHLVSLLSIFSYQSRCKPNRIQLGEVICRFTQICDLHRYQVKSYLSSVLGGFGRVCLQSPDAGFHLFYPGVTHILRNSQKTASYRRL